MQSTVPASTNTHEARRKKVRPGAGMICVHLLSPARATEPAMRVATSFAGAGYSVTVVDVEYDGAHAREETRQGIHFKHIMLPARLQKHYGPTNPVIWLAFKLLRMWRAMFAVAATPADAYHAYDVMALPACLLASALRRRPLVIDSRELPLMQPPITTWRLLHALAVRFLRVAFAHCAATITVSPPLVAEMQRLYGGPPAVVVRNVPVYQPTIQSDRLRQRLGLPPSTAIALYQGGIQDNRSLDVLVRAARHLDAGIVIVLMGNGPQRDAIEHLIVEEDVSDRVKMLPAAPYAELFAYTASADVGLIVYRGSYSPNVQFCLPNKLFEYMMAGIPVVASRLDAVAEVIESYQVGALVPSLEPTDVARTISTLLADPEGRATMRRNALAAAQQVFRWDVEREVLIGLYNRLVSPQAAHPTGSEEAAPVAEPASRDIGG